MTQKQEFQGVIRTKCTHKTRLSDAQIKEEDCNTVAEGDSKWHQWYRGNLQEGWGDPHIHPRVAR